MSLGRVCLVGVLAVLGGVLGAIGAAGPAAGQVPGDTEVAEVVLADLDPPFAAGDDVVTLRGRLTNRGDAPLADPLPTLRWSSDPVQTLDDLALVESNPLFRYGRVDYRYSDTVETLGAGESATFRIDVPIDALVVSPGVYVVGVDVLATLPDGLRVFVASARTTLAVDVEVESPLDVAMLWPLAAAPSLLPDGRLSRDSLAEQISPSGRLSTLVDRARGTPVTWVVDPDLVLTTAAMVDGYETVGQSPSTTGPADAARFLSELSAVLPSADDVRQVPLADPDVGGSLAADVDPATVEASLTDGSSEPVLSDLVGRPIPHLAVLVDRPVTNRMLGSYLRSGVGTVALDSGAVQSIDEAGRARLERPKARDIDAIVARRPPAAVDGVDAPLAARQWLLSTTAVLAATAPQQAPTTGQVVAPPLLWQVDGDVAAALLEGWQDAPWVEPVPLSSVARSESPVTLGRGGPRPPALPAPIVDGLVTGLDDAERLGPLLAEPLLDPGELTRTVARGTSHAWQEDEESGLAYVRTLAATVTSVERDLSLLVSPSITLSSRSGRFPVTLVNGSELDVVVGVAFTSQNTTRLRVEDIEPVLLTAGEKRTFTATALATANGRVQVSASLVTTDQMPIGRPETAIVDVTNAGALGWTVIAAGGVLLAAALVRARLRARRRTADSDGVEHPDVEVPT